MYKNCKNSPHLYLEAQSCPLYISPCKTEIVGSISGFSSSKMRLRMEVMSPYDNTLQPHYSMPHYKAVFNITRPCHGSQMDYFAICL